MRSFISDKYKEAIVLYEFKINDNLLFDILALLMVNKIKNKYLNLSQRQIFGCQISNNNHVFVLSAYNHQHQLH
jgi:hypothetical protein